jgi:hypothetical protein
MGRGGVDSLSPGRPDDYLTPVMLQALRTRRFALATLAAFLLAQPAAACAALCLFESHGAAAHAMPRMSGASSVLAGRTCHTTSAGAVQHDPLQALSPMAPTRVTVLAVAPARRVEPARALPAAPRLISHTVEPPPPRFV